VKRPRSSIPFRERRRRLRRCRRSTTAGQKLLIRMGPQNARVIKNKLREFRAEIVNKR
jgi:hypothetical protein